MMPDAGQDNPDDHSGSSVNLWSSKFLHVIITTVVCLASMAILLGLATTGYDPGLLSIVFCAGTLGAIANNYRRFFRIPSHGGTVSELLGSRLVTVQLYLSPLIGGLFAVVLYAMFMSGILSGVLFPKFPNVDVRYTDVTTFLMSTTPENNLDAAKVLLWSFLAGFAEKFVPNIVDKIVKDSSVPDTRKA
ncbi:MAG: hypothetical protein HY704_05100 [Gemmatimonadetes bacterium]|nr:hypothetical protein [Gemmatimonadota bacterium]